MIRWPSKANRLFTCADFNVSQHRQDPDITTNTARIDVPPMPNMYALEKGAKPVVLCSHLGRPDGEETKRFSMAPAAKVVEESLASLGNR